MNFYYNCTLGTDQSSIHSDNYLNISDSNVLLKIKNNKSDTFQNPNIYV